MAYGVILKAYFHVVKRVMMKNDGNRCVMMNLIIIDVDELY